MTSFELLDVDGADHLGEGPSWDAGTGTLWWVDILSRRIRRATLDGVEASSITTASEVGFVVPRRGGGLVAGLSGTLEAVTGDGLDEWSTLWTGPYDAAQLRINDGKTDRHGRVWFGTMHRAETEPIGCLYRWDGDGVTMQLDGIWVSNGLGWSPDGATMYYADSQARTIRAFDYDHETGDIAAERVLVEHRGDGVPDGLTVDVDGGIWSATWDGHRIVRYRPDGRLDREVRLPVAKPTSVAFAGPDLRTLVVTSARMQGTDGELAGRVFLLDVGVQGMAETRAL